MWIRCAFPLAANRSAVRSGPSLCPRVENPTTAEDVRKFCQAASGGEDRLKLVNYIRDVTASDFAGWQELSSLHGGGSPEALLTTLFHEWDVDRSEELVASELGISRVSR
ncbi:4-hydroxyphenylacetate 3-hydroxylase C-terminal domain-containing protein [Natrinema caseinilyticum]|uniref:4-hydroxyphenylacetate 3-hydroxylase C-terminal domain-containing protein n=1 Tax=Natrinema caseinilyticum TaxID=2961570 RepID=UPI0020C3ACD8|nr:4-hydroxyphenylacetate 3-hydroxylase C-terminal domain-containing protein [Natrinema caseinilyticum]